MKLTIKELREITEGFKDKDTIHTKAYAVVEYVNKKYGGSISEVIPTQSKFPSIVDFHEQDGELIFSVNFSNASRPTLWVAVDEVKFDGDRENE